MLSPKLSKRRTKAMLDHAQTGLWTLTYLLITYFGIRYRDEKPLLMPPIVGSMNFAWEINALILSGGFYGHILWTALDVAIFAHNVRLLAEKKLLYIYIYILYTVLLTCGLFFVFRTPDADGQLISSFLIDLFIALEFVLRAEKISFRGRLAIATTKLLGDLCAWLYYLQYSVFVKITGAAVLLINLFYLAQCLEFAAHRKKRR